MGHELRTLARYRGMLGVASVIILAGCAGDMLGPMADQATKLDPRIAALPASGMVLKRTSARASEGVSALTDDATCHITDVGCAYSAISRSGSGASSYWFGEAGTYFNSDRSGPVAMIGSLNVDRVNDNWENSAFLHCFKASALSCGDLEMLWENCHAERNVVDVQTDHSLMWDGAEYTRSRAISQTCQPSTRPAGGGGGSSGSGEQCDWWEWGYYYPDTGEVEWMGYVWLCTRTPPNAELLIPVQSDGIQSANVRTGAALAAWSTTNADLVPVDSLPSRVMVEWDRDRKHLAILFDRWATLREITAGVGFAAGIVRDPVLSARSFRAELPQAASADSLTEAARHQVGAALNTLGRVPRRRVGAYGERPVAPVPLPAASIRLRARD